MTTHELAEKLGQLIRQERRITNEILHLIVAALDRRAYLELGYPSMFEWLVKGFGYSHSAAYRRIEAAKLLRAVPTVTAKLESGEVNLSTVSKVQTVIKAQEKIAGRRVSAQEKAKVLTQIEGQSYRETEQTLLAMYPDACLAVKQEHRVTVSADTVRHSMNLSNETGENLKRAKEVLSHKFPSATDAQIFDYALRFMLEKIDPLRKKSSATSIAEVTTQSAADSASKRVRIKASDRAAAIQAAKASCTFMDPRTGKICGSRHQIQIDHIIPKARGGPNDSVNLRVRCRSHNLLEAERVFGRAMIDQFRKRNN